MKSELYKLLESISPVELSKLRDKRQDTSTRDKNLLLKKVTEIEEILIKLEVKISLKKTK